MREDRQSWISATSGDIPELEGYSLDWYVLPDRTDPGWGASPRLTLTDYLATIDQGFIGNEPFPQIDFVQLVVTSDRGARRVFECDNIEGARWYANKLRARGRKVAITKETRYKGKSERIT